MKKLLYFFSICIILCITSTSAVFAAGHSASDHDVWNGQPPFMQPVATISLNIEPPEAGNMGYPANINISSDSYSCFFRTYYNPFPTVAPDRQDWAVDYITFNIGSAPVVFQTNFNQTVSTHFSYTFNGTSYDIYYSVWSTGFINNVQGNFNGEKKNIYYDMNFYGYELMNSFGSQQSREAICKYFLFGVGDLDYIEPEPVPEEIPDSNLDIVGLLGSVSDVYTDDGSFGSTLRSAWNSFIQGLFSLLPDGLGDTIAAFNGGNNLFASQLGNVRTTIPGIQLIWDGPSIHHSSSDENITYTFWIDGSATADLAIYGQNYHAAVTFHKLQLRSSYIFYNPALIYYYSSNQDYQVVLDYILSNTNFSDSGSTASDQTVLNTTISRIYIQASKVDDNGDNHFGAVSYVDFSSGFPVVYEGVTDSIDDIESSDSDNGTTNTVTQDYTVSGDTIYYGDTITNNNITNNITAGGLVVGNGLGLLNAGISLIRAVLEMIKLLFVSYLIPFITLGWTGHT